MQSAIPLPLSLPPLLPPSWLKIFWLRKSSHSLLETPEWCSKYEVIYVRGSSNVNLTLVQTREPYKLVLRFHACVVKHPMVLIFSADFLELLKINSFPNMKYSLFLKYLEHNILIFPRIKFKITSSVQIFPYTLHTKILRATWFCPSTQGANISQFYYSNILVKYSQDPETKLRETLKSITTYWCMARGPGTIAHTFYC